MVTERTLLNTISTCGDLFSFITKKEHRSKSKLGLSKSEFDVLLVVNIIHYSFCFQFTNENCTIHYLC